MQLAALRDAFDRGDVRTVQRRGQNRAGFHRAAVHMHHAGAALAGVAAHMGARQAKMLAQKL